MIRPVLTVVLLLLVNGTARAQACLHDANETAEQAARRREALTATRMINNLQVNAPGRAEQKFLRYEELMTSPFFLGMQRSTNDVVKRISLLPGTDILPNWRLTLDVSEHGYWFMIKDKTDPCGFGYVSNQDGVIFSAEPIR
jgi:hypothetical protein